MRLLVVEEDPALRDMVTAGCVAAGHDVASCPAPPDALTYLERHAVDVLIADLDRSSLGVFDLIRRSRYLQPGLTVVALVGYPSPHSLEEVVRAGAPYLLFKPFRLEQLQDQLQCVETRRAFFGVTGEPGLSAGGADAGVLVQMSPAAAQVPN